MRAMELLRILAMPFQLSSLALVALTSLVLGVILGSGNFVTILLGLWLLWITLSWLTRYSFQMIDDAANGRRRASVASVEMMNPFSDLRCWLHPVLAVALIVLHTRRPELPVWPTLLAATLLFPPSIAASAMSGHAQDALNPVAVARVIGGFGIWYLPLALFIAACVGLGVLLARALGIGWLLFASLELLVLLGYAGIGAAVYLRRFELGFAPFIAPERKDEALEKQREGRRQQFIDELYKDLRVRESGRATASAIAWLQQLEPHQRHGDLQAILAAGRGWREGREFARLLRGLLPWLVARHEPALALAVADAGLATHPDFAPAEEATLIVVLEHALQAGRRRAAARLLENFLAGAQSGAPASGRLAALRERIGTPPTSAPLERSPPPPDLPA